MSKTQINSVANGKYFNLKLLVPIFTIQYECFRKYFSVIWLFEGIRPLQDLTFFCQFYPSFSYVTIQATDNRFFFFKFRCTQFYGNSCLCVCTDSLHVRLFLTKHLTTNCLYYAPYRKPAWLAIQRLRSPSPVSSARMTCPHTEVSVCVCVCVLFKYIVK